MTQQTGIDFNGVAEARLGRPRVPPREQRDLWRAQGLSPCCGQPPVVKPLDLGAGPQDVMTFPRHKPGCYAFRAERQAVAMLGGKPADDLYPPPFGGKP